MTVHLWEMDVESGVRRCVAGPFEGIYRGPVWSADGATVYFMGSAGGKGRGTALFAAAVDEGGARKIKDDDAETSVLAPPLSVDRTGSLYRMEDPNGKSVVRVWVFPAAYLRSLARRAVDVPACVGAAR